MGEPHEDTGEEDLARRDQTAACLADEQSGAIGDAEEQAHRRQMLGLSPQAREAQDRGQHGHDHLENAAGLEQVKADDQNDENHQHPDHGLAEAIEEFQPTGRRGHRDPCRIDRLRQPARRAADLVQDGAVEQCASDAQGRGRGHARSGLLDDLLFGRQTVGEQQKGREDRDVGHAQRRRIDQRIDERKRAPDADQHACQPGKAKLRRQADQTHHGLQHGGDRLDDAEAGQDFRDDGNRHHDARKQPVDLERFPRLFPDQIEPWHRQLPKRMSDLLTLKRLAFLIKDCFDLQFYCTRCRLA